MAVAIRDAVLQRGDAKFIAPSDKGKVAAGIVPITVNFYGTRDRAEHPDSQYLVLLGERKNEPYKGMLAFPTGKATEEELGALSHVYEGHYRGRPIFSGGTTARREMREELGLSKPSGLDQIELETGTEFAVLDKQTGYTIYVTPMLFYHSQYGTTLPDLLRQSEGSGSIRSDLANPKFYTLEEIAALHRQGRLAPIVHGSIIEAFKMLEDRADSRRKNDEEMARFKLHEAERERRDAQKKLGKVLRALGA